MTNALKLYRSLSPVKKAALWYTAAMILQKGVSFITTPVYTRLLSEEQYGLNSVYQSWSQIVSVIAVAALDRSVTVGFAKYEDRRCFLSSIQFLMTLTTGACLAVVLAFRDFFAALFGLPVKVILVMFAAALCSQSLANWSWYQRFEYRYKSLAALTICFTAAVQCAAITAILISPEPRKGEAFVIASGLAAVVLDGIIYAGVFLKGRVFFNRRYWAFALPYSLLILPHALAQIVLNSSDRIMIDKLCGRDEAAFYGVVYSAAMTLSVVVMSVTQAIAPWLFDKIKTRDFAGVRVKTNQLLVLTAALALLVSLFAPDIVRLLAPPSYAAAVWVFPPVAASVFFNALYLMLAGIESYFEKSVYFSIATVTGAAANIALNFVFIPRFGFAAAGYTTLACYVIFALMHYAFMRKICRDKLEGVTIFDARFICLLSTAVIAGSVGVALTYGTPAARYALAATLAVLCVVKRKRIVRRVKAALWNEPEKDAGGGS